MILYFSATGNCKYVASRLSEESGSEAVSIVDCMNTGRFDFEDSSIGIVSPTYNFGLPSIVCDFLEKASIRADYLYFIATYGTTPGGTAHFAQKYLGERFDACYSVRMPDTWTVRFDLSTPEKTARFLTTTEDDISFVIGSVRHRMTGNLMNRALPTPVAQIFYRPTYEMVRKTSHFSVEDSCIGCGLCAKKCPVQAIEMHDKHPVWGKDKCVMCLGCLHRCPKFSIQYGSKTKKHGQYVNPNVRV